MANVTTIEPSFQPLCFFLVFKNMLLLFLCMYGYIWECVWMPLEARDIETLGTRVTGDCESINVGAGN